LSVIGYVKHATADSENQFGVVVGLTVVELLMT